MTSSGLIEGKSTGRRSDRWLIFLFLLIPLAQSFVSLNWIGQGFYGMTAYLLTYKFGFIRRGLFGEALSSIPFLSVSKLVFIALILTGTAIAVAYGVFLRPFCRSAARAALFAFLLSGPGVLPHCAYNTGFTDNLLISLALLAAGLISIWDGWLSVGVTTLLCTVALLIHEGFVLMFYPVVLLRVIAAERRRRISLGAATLHLGVVGAVFIVIMWFGKLPVSFKVYNDYMQSRTNLNLAPNDVLLPLINSARENVTYVLGHLSRKVLAGEAFTLITSIPYFAALGVCLVRTFGSRPNRRRFDLAITAAILCSPLLLTIIAIDVMRFVSAACANISFYVLFAEWRDHGNEPPAATKDLTPSLSAFVSSRWFTAVFAYSLVSGAFGIAGNRLAGKLVFLMNAR